MASLERRQFLTWGLVSLAACSRIGDGLRAQCLTWGGPGTRRGKFRKPRAVGAHAGQVYVIDTTGRVQVFDPDGAFLRQWKLPETQNGTPTDVSFAADGKVLIPDTHSSRILEYTPEGELTASWGSYGREPGAFIYPTGVALAADGTHFISEYGLHTERLQVFGPDRSYARHWTGVESGAGPLGRPMAVRIDAAGLVYVCDTGNHRIQVFDQAGEFVRAIGEAGAGPGQLKFPYDLALTAAGDSLACEYGNNRVSRWETSGRFVASWGRAGRMPGEFSGPRGVAVSPEGYVFVADTDNDRIQRLRLEDLA